MLADGWPALAAAAVVPLLVVLTIGLHGVALGLLWLLLTILFWLILGECLRGPWGRRRQIGTVAVSSLLAAVVVVSVIGRWAAQRRTSSWLRTPNSRARPRRCWPIRA